nr:unnamed protein product [Spirometra erinaceieuropaei]
MQDDWTTRKAEQIQGYVDRNEWKDIFAAIKTVYGLPTKGTAPRLSADGCALLTEITQILQRSAEQSRDVLNRPPTISEAVIARLLQVETNDDLDLPPSLHERIRFSAMLMDTYCDECPGIRAVYRTAGQLLNQCRMHFQSRVSTTIVHELLFADVCALKTASEMEMQRCMYFFAAACDNFSLVINTERTMVMHQPPLDSAYFAPRINVDSA